LYKGIVIHHGSLPLQVRLLIEKFTNLGYSKICFATSTLMQGINMPFDAIILDHFEKNKPLELKNMIGRAGRSNSKKSSFDYGFVVINKSRITDFKNLMNRKEKLNEKSLLESESDDDSDFNEFKDAILNDKLSQEYNMSNTQLERLTNNDVSQFIEFILNNMFNNGVLITENEYNNMKKSIRNKLKDCFKNIYSNYLNRNLSDGEKTVVSTAIRIFIFMIYGKKFSNIVGYRYFYLTKKIEKNKIIKLEKTEKFVAMYNKIPNKNLKNIPLYPKNTPIEDVRYDLVVFDTYDYIDKILGFSLNNVFYAAFDNYYKSYGDIRAEQMCEMIKYGTIDSTEQYMIKYGFSFEIIEILKPYIKKIDNNQILFKNYNNIPKYIKYYTNRYR